MKPIRWSLLVVLAAVVLAGCETTRVGAPGVAEPTADSSVAEKAERDGEFIIAAREYGRLAQASRPPSKQHFELRAADNLIRAGQLREARYLLEQTDLTGLDSSFFTRRQILQARILSAEGAHEKAIRVLDEAARARKLNPDLLAEVFRVRAQAELALDNPIGAVRNLINREQYIVGTDAIADNQKQLWNILDAMPRARLAAELNMAREPVLAGWIELALASIDNAGRMGPAIENWRKAYPKHPASEALLASLVKPAAGLISRIERIALLLPLSSDFSVAAEAVRDGFLGMQGLDPRPDKPTVKVYDFGADPLQAAELYKRAVADGAQVVVGPLGREAADAILQKSTLSVPTLLLSHTDLQLSGASARNLFQFGLPPEQEARQVAERAYLDGHRRAAVLYPDSPWGQRMQSAFVDHWQRLGGLVLANASYTEGQGDHSDSIKSLLNIAQSEQRKDLLANKIKQKLQFEPRPRQDLDFIFLVADAKRGRLIKPQLDFYRAVRVPVYSTSHIFTGRIDSRHDVDLNGVLFADMPWMLVHSGKLEELRRRVQGNWPHAQSDLDRLYALGIDSYSILPHLNQISTDAAARFGGVTSTLSLDRGGRLQRQLTWAQFSRGAPKLIDTSLKIRQHLEVEATPEG
jgi:outer membrane PBP1 activator LpoA protein